MTGQRDGQDQDGGGHYARGQCPDCGGWYRVKARGLLAAHPGTRRDGTCPGTGLAPVDPVACARCGKTGRRIEPVGVCSTCLGKVRAAGALPRGACPVCGAGGGTVNGRMIYHTHRPPGASRLAPCPGVGQPPARGVTA